MTLFISTDVVEKLIVVLGAVGMDPSDSIIPEKLNEKIGDAIAPASSASTRSMPSKKLNNKFLILGAVAAVLIILIIGFILINYANNPSVPPVNPPVIPPIGSISQQKLILGTVVDESGMLLKGVKITTNFFDIPGIYSNDFGYYSISSNSVREGVLDLIVTFTKEGFVPIHKPISLAQEKIILDVTMFPSTGFEKIDLTKPINAKMNGAELNSDAGSFVVKGTNQNAASANVSLTPFDPTNEKELEAFPGTFSGVQKDGTTTAIETFGFMKVQVKDDSGNSLDLAKGKTATVRLPISTNLRDSSPQEIPLWYFDENRGTWIEKTKAQKHCDTSACYYEGSIDTIASWWNCDATLQNSGAIDIFDSLLYKLFMKLGDWLDDAKNWTIFSESFTNSKWRLLLDAASMFFPPVNWAYSAWIVLNPNTTGFEKIGAIIGCLPFLNANIGAHILGVAGLGAEKGLLVYSSMEMRGISHFAAMADGMIGLERAGVSEELRLTGAAERAAGKEVSVTAEEAARLSANADNAYSKVMDNMINNVPASERVAALKELNEANNALSEGAKARKYLKHSEAGGTSLEVKYDEDGLRLGEPPLKLAIRAETFDQVMEAYSNPKVQDIIGNMHYKIGLDRGINPATTSNPYKGITIYFEHGATAQEFKNVATSLDAALEGYSGARTAGIIPGDLQLGNNGVYGRWATDSDGFYRRGSFLRGAFDEAPANIKQVADELASAVKPAQAAVEVPRLVAPSVSETQSLWISRKSHSTREYADLLYALLEDSSDQDVKNAMQNSYLVDGFVNNPLNAVGEEGYQKNDSLFNLGGESVPLNGFNVIPLSSAGYNEAISAKGYIDQSLGDSLIFIDATTAENISDTENIMLLTPVYTQNPFGSNGAQPADNQTGLISEEYFLGSAMVLKDPNSAKDWVVLRAATSFNNAEDKAASIVEGTMALDFNNGKQYLINSGSIQLVKVNYRAVSKTYNQGNLVAEEYTSDPSLNKYYIYDALGNLSKLIAKDVETEYLYDSNSSGITKTTKVLSSGYSYSIIYSFDKDTNTFTELVPSNGNKVVTRYDSNQNLIYSQETTSSTVKTYEYGANQSKFTVKQMDSLGNEITSSATTFDKTNNTSVNESISDVNGQKVKIIIAEFSDSRGTLLSRNAKYFVFSGSDFVLKTEENTVYNYSNVETASPINGKMLPAKKLIGAQTTKTDSNGSVTNEATAYDGNPLNQYYDIKTNENGLITEISKKKDKDLFSALAQGFALVDSTKFEYDGLGRVSKETRSDGIIIDYKYSPNGALIEAKSSDGKVYHPQTDDLSKIGQTIGNTTPQNRSAGILATVVLKGIDYTSQMSSDILLNPDASVTWLGSKVYGKPNGKAELKIKMPNVESEGIPVTLPPAGQLLKLNVDYGAVVLPIKLEDTNGYAGLSIKVMDGDNKVFEFNKYLSKESSSTNLILLVRPRASAKIIVDTIFTNDFHKEIPVSEIKKGEIILLDSLLVSAAKPQQREVTTTSNFNCLAHYAYIKEITPLKDNNFTSSSTYKELYYDGRLIDSSDRISNIQLFGDHIAYEKEKFSNDGNYCGDYYFYKSGVANCTNRKMHIIYDGNDIGEGESPILWANHIAYKKAYPGKGIVYDGNSYGVNCSSGTDYYLWGDNFVYTCNSVSSTNAKDIYWNNNLMTKGRIAGVHKNLALIYNGDILNESKNYCYSIYDKGVKVFDFDMADDAYKCGGPFKYDDSIKAGAFGDNWWVIEGDGTENGGKISYNGKQLYSGNYPQITIFGNDTLYGNFDELYFNGQKVGTRENDYGILNNINLVSGNYGFFAGNQKVNYNGTSFPMTSLHEGKLQLFENYWIVTDSEGGINEYNLFLNGKKVAPIVFDSATLFSGKVAYVDSSTSTKDFYGQLVYGGKLMDKDYYAIREYSIFGDHILYSKTIEKPYNQEFFIDGTSIGFGNTGGSNKDIIKNVYVWPEMTPKTILGTQYSNENNFNVDLSAENTFDSIWLYCTNEWK
ncbi:MAG: hypothetical protein NTY48_04855 [Candidatus Diapherotrites archaeon]|nr:hypothetical protein [Candidatus Diapherotrites archaeon]